MDIKIQKTTYFISEGSEKAIIELKHDGTLEFLRIRLLPKSDFIERALNIINDTAKEKKV